MTTTTDGERSQLDARLRTTIVIVLVCGAALSVGGLVSRGPSAAVSVGVGAAVAATNLWALARIVTALLPSGSKSGARVPSSAAAWSLLAALKMFGLFVVVWMLLRYAVVSPLPMLVGFGALPIGIAIGSLVSDRSAEGEP
ncbi:MAG: ATP synthase subunit I [Polyangiaceae bacterium]